MNPYIASHQVNWFSAAVQSDVTVGSVFGIEYDSKSENCRYVWSPCVDGTTFLCQKALLWHGRIGLTPPHQTRHCGVWIISSRHRRICTEQVGNLLLRECWYRRGYYSAETTETKTL